MQEKFATLESEINRPLTYLGIALVWAVIIATAVVILTLFYEVLDYGFTSYLYNKPDQFFILLIAGIVLIAVSVFLIIYMTKGRKNDYHRVVVDEKGIGMYNVENRLISSLQYSDLCSSNDRYLSDVSSRTGYQPYFTHSLLVFKYDKSGGTVMSQISFNNNYYSFKNKYELYRHFLLGVQTFRPDLKINSRTLEEYLTPEPPPSPKFGKFEWIITMVAFAIVIGLIYVFYLFIGLFSK
ncbi:hypothetical protein [Chryseobacterium sp. 2987]|uniref:hypothetical protein n=1 Tax=Chryseobacterium sp. 2987 TaxID=2817767 RepID=UPI00285D344F|nr:hypothetical protein [Chryseobacterium sp. 2987]MDR6920529.1 hypothetical protein [Chryseobacterium sp. 2987]